MIALVAGVPSSGEMVRLKSKTLLGSGKVIDIVLGSLSMSPKSVE